MKVCLCRVDDRLIHGQITAAWTRKYNISHICVVDDELAADRLAARVISMTVPPKIEVMVLPVAEMAALLEGERGEIKDARAMLLFRSIRAANALFAAAGPVVDRLTLGGLSSKLGRKEISKNLFLSREETELILEIMNVRGVPAVLQMLPDDVPVDIKTIFLAC